jgi:proline racemase
MKAVQLTGHRGRIRTLDLIDTQAGGDVSRIVLGGVDPLPGKNVRRQQIFLEKHGDGLRRLLLSEPYGDPAMSVNLVVRPGNPEAAAGYIIMEAMGYPMYSGSNTICTATAVLQSGLIAMEEGEQRIVLESPAGLARIKAQCRDGYVRAVTTQGEPAYVAVRDLRTDVPRHGSIRYDVVWSGGFYALIDAGEAGFELVRDEEAELAAFAHAFVNKVRPEFVHEHPALGNVGPLPFVHFMGPAAADGAGLRARGATYVHPDVICRSPTGTGTSARMALMAERGELKTGQWLENTSPRGSSFTGTLLEPGKVGEFRAWHSHITGRAWTLAHSRIEINLDDPLVDASDLETVLSGAGTR